MTETKTITIPVPDNPHHVHNMASIELLKAQGYEGPDASLIESLFYYGLAWRKLETETIFIYRHPLKEGWFDRDRLDNDLNVREHFDWVKWEELFESCGIAPDEWDGLPLEQKINNLLDCYGPENIFGSSYWEGFQITEGPEPFTTLDEMIRSEGFDQWQASNLGNDLFIDDPDRAARMHDAAEDGSDGSTHAEHIADWERFLEEQEISGPDHPGMIKEETYTTILKEIGECQKWHEENGSLNKQVG